MLVIKKCEFLEEWVGLGNIILIKIFYIWFMFLVCEWGNEIKKKIKKK